MNRSIQGLAAAAAAAFLLAVVPATAQDMTSADKVLAGLANLSADEREKRLVEGAKKEGVFDVVPNYRGKQMQRHVGLFKKRYPWLKVNVSDLNSNSAIERAVAEATAGRHLTDASKMNLPDYVTLEGKNLLARNPTPATKKVLPQYRGFVSADNLWVPQSVSEFGMSYNSKMVKAEDAPKNWFDLCKPIFRGQVAFDPGQPMHLAGAYAVMDSDMGKFAKWLECVGKNDPIIIRGNTTRLTLMLAGDHAVQGINSYYGGITRVRKNPRKAPFVPVFEAPIFVFSSVIWVNRNARHPHAAALYADWIISDESQEFLLKELRGPITKKHPFVPADAQLVIIKWLSKDIANKHQELWRKYIGKR